MSKEYITTIPYVRKCFYAAYANLPTSGIRIGDLGYATDRLVLYRWNGTAWEYLTIHFSSGTAANIPTAADLPNGSCYFETDTGLLKQVQAGAWVSITQVGIVNTVYTDDLQHSDDAEKSTISATYVKLKEILLSAPLTLVRVAYDWKDQFGTGYWRVYKNGSPIGTEKSGTGSAYVTESEDIDLAASASDLIQVYVKSDGTNAAFVKNFRLHYDLAHAPHTNQDP